MRETDIMVHLQLPSAKEAVPAAGGLWTATAMHRPQNHPAPTCKSCRSRPYFASANACSELARGNFSPEEFETGHTDGQSRPVESAVAPPSPGHCWVNS